MVKCCPHCSKKFKMKKSLAKHMMLCQLDNKDKNELTVYTYTKRNVVNSTKIIRR